MENLDCRDAPLCSPMPASFPSSSELRPFFTQYGTAGPSILSYSSRTRLQTDSTIHKLPGKSSVKLQIRHKPIRSIGLRRIARLAVNPVNLSPLFTGISALMRSVRGKYGKNLPSTVGYIPRIIADRPEGAVPHAPTIASRPISWNFLHKGSVRRSSGSPRNTSDFLAVFMGDVHHFTSRSFRTSLSWKAWKSCGFLQTEFVWYIIVSPGQ